MILMKGRPAGGPVTVPALAFCFRMALRFGDKAAFFVTPLVFEFTQALRLTGSTLMSTWQT